MAVAEDHNARYGWAHRRLRARWAAKIKRGGVACVRCGREIAPGSRWDLGHDDEDRMRHSGPEHRRCNRATVTNLKQAARPAPAPAQHSRDWYA